MLGLGWAWGLLLWLPLHCCFQNIFLCWWCGLSGQSNLHPQLRAFPLVCVSEGLPSMVLLPAIDCSPWLLGVCWATAGRGVSVGSSLLHLYLSGRLHRDPVLLPVSATLLVSLVVFVPKSFLPVPPDRRISRSGPRGVSASQHSSLHVSRCFCSVQKSSVCVCVCVCVCVHVHVCVRMCACTMAVPTECLFSLLSSIHLKLKGF